MHGPSWQVRSETCDCLSHVRYVRDCSAPRHTDRPTMASLPTVAPRYWRRHGRGELGEVEGRSRVVRFVIFSVAAALLATHCDQIDTPQAGSARTNKTLPWGQLVNA